MDLALWCLQTEEHRRPTSFKDVLEHPFLQIDETSDELASTLERHESDSDDVDELESEPEPETEAQPDHTMAGQSWAHGQHLDEAMHTEEARVEAFHRAIQENDAVQTKQLLDGGGVHVCLPAYSASFGVTMYPLHRAVHATATFCASATGRPSQVLELLLEEVSQGGAVPPTERLQALDGRINYGYTPFMLACHFGNLSCVQLLLQAGCSTNLTNDLGKSGLDIALANNHDGVTSFLREQAAHHRALQAEFDALSLRPEVNSNRRDELQVAPDRLNFFVLQPFQTWTHIGGGAYGDIYKVKNVFPPLELGQGQQVADLVVKSIKADNAEDEEEAISALRSEIKALCSIQHKHIVAVYGFALTARPGSDAESYVLLLEPCDSDLNAEIYPKDADGRSTGARLTWARRLKLALEMAQGMEAIHAAHQLHLDLKPGNILLRNGDDGNTIVKIADFGMGSDMKKNDDNTYDTGSPTGTWDYMAPEAFRGRGLCAASDIFSFGVMLWELFTQRQVYTGFEDFDPSLHQINAIPNWMAKDADIRPLIPETSCPEPWKLLMVCCWAHFPEDRLDFTVVRQALELFRDVELPEQWEKPTSTQGSNEAEPEVEPAAEPDSVSTPKTAREWLDALGYLEDAQIDEAVAYAQEEGEPCALTDMDDEDFEEMIEEMALGDNEQRFRAAVDTIGVTQPPEIVKPTSLDDTVATWLPTLNLLSDDQIQTVLAYTQQEGTLASLHGMESEDFTEMIEELELEDDAAVAFHTAVAAIGNGPGPVEHKLVRGLSTSATSEAVPPEAPPVSSQDRARAWLQSLDFLSTEAVEAAVGWVQVEGKGELEFKEMEEDDLAEMVGEDEMGLESEVAARFRTAVQNLGTVAQLRSAFEIMGAGAADEHVTTPLQPIVEATPEQAGHEPEPEPEPEPPTVRRTSELEQWLDSHYPQQWREAQLLALDKVEIVTQLSTEMQSKEDKILALEAELEELKRQLRGQDEA